VNSHDVTVLGYLAVLLAGIILQLIATRTRAPIPPLGKVFAWAMSTRTRRVGLLVAWAWVGLHFFARLSPKRRTGTAPFRGHHSRPSAHVLPGSPRPYQLSVI
jgi:uncharacterized protein DUF6186